MVEINLDQEQLKWCDDHAKEIVEHYGGDKTRGSGSYNHNKISSNWIGVKSEVAAVVWLKQNFEASKVLPYFIDFKNSRNKPDIGLFDNFIEVKGLRNKDWDKWKRCIPPNQLKKYVDRKAIVIWTTTEGSITDGNVKLKGWNYASDVKDNGVYLRTICDQTWLQDDSLMRSMEDLKEKLIK